MNTRISLIVASLSVVVAGALATPADAEVRLMFNRYGLPYFESYDPAPDYVAPKKRKHRTSAGNADANGNPVGYDANYYSPFYLPPSKKPAKKVMSNTASTANSATARARSTAKADQTTTTASIAPKAKAAPVSTSSANAVSCDKALKIVGDYGFSSVKSKDCQGQVYEFSATRGGKQFLIKLSAASGELTEVKKID
jgi:hypothetical protein